MTNVTDPYAPTRSASFPREEATYVPGHPRVVRKHRTNRWKRSGAHPAEIRVLRSKPEFRTRKPTAHAQNRNLNPQFNGMGNSFPAGRATFFLAIPWSFHESSTEAELTPTDVPLHSTLVSEVLMAGSEWFGDAT